MAKILHTADIHLGVKLSGLGKSGDKIRTGLKQVFSETIDLAASEKVDAVLIAGDLFDSNQVSNSVVRFVMSEIERLGDIPCVVLPGTHDCLEEGSIYRSLDDADKPRNLHLLLEKKNPVVKFEQKGLSIYGVPNYSNRSTSNPISSVKRTDDPGLHILLAHGSYRIPGRTAEDDYPFDLDDIEYSGFDYCALGHWHSCFELPTTQVKASYSGSPETLAFDQVGAGNVLLVDFDNGVSIERRQMGKTKWIDLELSADSFKYTIEVEQELRKYVGADTVLRATLTGLSSSESYINTEILSEQLGDQFLYLKVIDSAEVLPENLSSLNIPVTTIMGQFIKQMSAEIEQAQDVEEKRVLRDSLRTGYALLSGKDVL